MKIGMIAEERVFIMKRCYKIADCCIEIESLYEEIHVLCRDYIAEDETPDFYIHIQKQDIAYEQERSDREMLREGKTSRIWRESYLETLAVYRKIADFMAERNTILFHGSVIAVDQQAYLFTAKSGTGKSTHTRLWREYFKDRAVMVNDDKPLLKITDSQVIAFGTPWNGKHHLGETIAVPLKAICILRRGAVNEIHQISRQQAYAMLLQQMHKSAKPEILAVSLGLLDRMAEQIPLYELKCNQNSDAVIVSYNAMKGSLS